MSKKIVFVSSTFDDLKEYRRIAWDVLEQYDVEVVGMERFGARSQKPLEVCLDEVSRSDIYLGIIGFRLGTIDDETGLSFTQREYEQALKLSIDVRIYFADENVAIMPAKFCEPTLQLKAFKKRLKDGHTIDEFQNLEDFEKKLKALFDKELSKKNKEGRLKDDYLNSKQVIEQFSLLPWPNSGKLVKLKVKFEREPFLVSKELCNHFNLSFGHTIGCQIQILAPELKSAIFEEIFMERRAAEEFLKLDRSKTYEVHATINFAEQGNLRKRSTFKNEIFNPLTMLRTSMFEETRIADATVILKLYSVERS